MLKLTARWAGSLLAGISIVGLLVTLAEWRFRRIRNYHSPSF